MAIPGLRIMIGILMALDLALLAALFQHWPVSSIIVAFLLGRLWWDIADYYKDAEGNWRIGTRR